MGGKLTSEGRLNVATTTVTRTIDRWRVGKGYTQTSTSLAIYRILFALTELFILGPARIGVGVASDEVGHIPAGMFHPPLGPAMLLNAWPPVGVIVAIELLYTASLGAILIGAFTRTASLTAATCGLILTTLVYSEGKIDHSILWTVLLPAVMAWTSWGDTWSVDAGRERVRQRKGFQSDSYRAVALMALALGVVFGAAATVKALTGWLDPGTSSTLGWVFAHKSQYGIGAGPPLLFSATPGFVWLVMDYATVMFEAGMLVAALRRHWLVPYLSVAVLFHIGANFLGFPVFFEIILIYILFIRLDAVAGRLRKPLDAFGRVARQRPLLVCAATALVLAVYSIVALVSDGPWTLVRVLGDAGVAGLLVGVALWPAFVVVAIIVYAKRSTPPLDRPGNSLPAWAFPAAVAFLAAQTAVTFAVSEPYPSLTGPRFMGSYDDGQSINFAEQHFWVVNDGRRIEVHPTDVMDISRAGAIQLETVRFPGPLLDSHGHVMDEKDAGLQDRLRNQYHHFSSQHLPHYGGPLSGDEKAWIRASLAKQHVACDPGCSLEVEWRRLSFDRTTGDKLLEETTDRQNYPLQ